MIILLFLVTSLFSGTVSDDFSSLNQIAAQHNIDWDAQTNSITLALENTETAFSQQTSTVTSLEAREYGFEFVVQKEGLITGLGRYNLLDWNLWINLWNTET